MHIWRAVLPIVRHGMRKKEPGRFWTTWQAHESEIERIVNEFERQADTNALETRVYDYLSHHPIKTHRTCDEPYAKLDFNGICREVFDFHDQIIDLYQTMVGKAEIPEVRELMESLLTMEQNESKRLARQVGRMDDL